MLRFQGGQYAVTPEDRLWLLRAVQAEGPPQLQVARALVNGFAWARGTGKWKGSLMGWVRAYAQPVNSRWFTSGDKFKAQHAAAPEAERAGLMRLAYRREAEHSTRTSFTAAVEGAVNDALSSPWASDVTDYAAPTLDASKKGMVARSVVKKGENRFWTRAVGWTGYIATEGGAAGGAGVALALLALGWLLMRGRA
jgi:hypothetical protein